MVTLRWAIVEARSRAITASFVIVFLALAAFLVSLVVLPSTPTVRWGFAASHLAIEAAAAVLTALRVVLVPRERMAWGSTCAALVCLVAGDTFETLTGGMGSSVGQANTILSQMFYAGFFVGIFVGLGLIVRSRVANRTRDVWLDGLISGLGLLAVVSLVVSLVVSAPGDSPGIGTFIPIVYPAAPLVFVAVLLGALTGLDRRPSPAWWLQVAAALLMAASNLVFVRSIATGGYTYGSPLDLLWPLATVLIAAAAWSSPMPPPPSDSTFRGMIFVPATFSFCALFVLWINEIGPGVLWTKRFAMAAIVVGIVRLLFAVSEAEKLRQREKLLNRSIRVARDAALQAALAKSTFLATMSHEIRTPLNAVLGMNELLIDTDLNPEQREYVQNATLSGSLLLELITDILDFSKIEAGAIDLEERQFELARLVDASVTVLSFAAQSKKLPIVAEYSTDCPKTVIGDPTRLRQILVNLISNAVKFTEQGEVRVFVSRGVCDDRVRFEVSDTGQGIDARQLVTLFDPFTQADSSTTRTHGGSGLGLSICQSLVGMMGGHIEVDSTLGVGSTFRFEIDLDDVSIPPEFAALELGFGPWGPDSRRSSSRSLRVLVAEDNDTLALLSTRLVAKLGHDVSVVTNGAAAVDAVTAEPYDVVLMDVHMPVMDGLQATRSIRAAGIDIAQPHIVALTAGATERDREECRAAGMDAYVSKPFTGQDLRRAFLAVEITSDGPADPAPIAAPPRLFDELDELGPSAKAEVLSAFSARSAEDLSALERALIDREPGELRFIAHRLRGGSLALGATDLAAACLRLESAPDDESATAAMVVDVRHALEDLARVIDTEIHAHPQP